jgi:putative membrane protein
MLVSWLLAVVLGLAPDAVYPAYASLAHRPGGISALADQQLAAGMMWVPGSIPYTIAIFVAAFRWLDPAGATRRRIELRPRETS